MAPQPANSAPTAALPGPGTPWRLLDTLGAGTVDIIGNSMGGAIALSIAAARPAAVRRIVLMGSMGVAMALPRGLDTVWGYTPGWSRCARSSACSRTTAG